VNVQTREPLPPGEARALLEAAPGVAVVDDPANHGYPTARAAAGRDEVFVGRTRQDPSHPRALNMWVVSDNLLKGAATNAVQLAEALHERGLVRIPAGAAA
jgi:aspartate-semialdehyde dehydrogenase